MSKSLVPSHAMRNILRYEHNGATSWVVRVKRSGRQYVEYFADGHEGPEASLRRAIVWRNDLEKRLTPWNKLHRRSSVSRTGVIGVSVLDDRTRAGTIVRRWVAQWPIGDGRMRHRSFSVLKYGERKARRLAIEARRQGVADLFREREVR